MKSPIRNYALFVASAIALGLPAYLDAFAQDAPIIPVPVCAGGRYDADAGIAYFDYTGCVPGAYYMVGVQYDNLDPTNQFDPWSLPFQATSTDMVIVTWDPLHRDAAFYIMLPFQVPQTAFNFSDYDTINNGYTFVATASTNILYYQRKLNLGDDTYATLLTEGRLTNVLFATFNTQTRPNGYYYVDDAFLLPGIQAIRGWETVWNHNVGYVDIENPFFAYYPPKYTSGLGAPNWTFFGTPGDAYTVTVSSVSDDESSTNLLATAEISGDITTVNGGAFCVGWDGANDDGGPLYLVQVFDNSLGGSEALNGLTPMGEGTGVGMGVPIFTLSSGSFHCQPYYSWLHATEGFSGILYGDAAITAFGLHGGTAALISTLYETDWGDNYAITQTKHPYSPDFLLSQNIVDILLSCLNINSPLPTTDSYVSEFTAFGHMNAEEMFGGPGSPIPDTGGFTYRQLALARGTRLSTNEANVATIKSTKGAFKCMMLEGCESASENLLLFKAGGIPRDDDLSAYPTWGMGYWWYVPVIRTSGAVGFCEDSAREWVLDYAPTAYDAVTSKAPWYPVTCVFADLLGCLNSQYTLGSVSTDRGLHQRGSPDLGYAMTTMSDTGGSTTLGFAMTAMSNTGTSSAQSTSSVQTGRPHAHSNFLDVPRTSAPVAFNPFGLSSADALSGTSARALRMSSVRTPPSQINPKLAQGLWTASDFRSALAPIRAEAQAQRAQAQPSVAPEVIEALLAGQDYLLIDTPPMPPVWTNGVWVDWEDVYGPLSPIKLPISDGVRAAAMQSIQHK